MGTVIGWRLDILIFHRLCEMCWCEKEKNIFLASDNVGDGNINKKCGIRLMGFFSSAMMMRQNVLMCHSHNMYIHVRTWKTCKAADNFNVNIGFAILYVEKDHGTMNWRVCGICSTSFAVLCVVWIILHVYHPTIDVSCEFMWVCVCVRACKWFLWILIFM